MSEERTVTTPYSKYYDEVEARADKAPVAPWESFEGAVLDAGGMVIAEPPRGFIAHIPTFEFIAHARTDVPALVTRCLELEAALAYYAIPGGADCGLKARAVLGAVPAKEGN